MDYPLGVWCANTRECLAMLLRPGNAGSDTFAEHRDVLAAAIRQVPARFRNKILVRVDGAGASHELVKHLPGMPSPRRKVLLPCGPDADHRRTAPSAGPRRVHRPLQPASPAPGIAARPACRASAFTRYRHQQFLIDALDGDRAEVGCALTQLPGLLVDL